MPSNKGEILRTLGFAALVSVVSGGALLWAGTALAPKIQRNERVKKYRNVLEVLGVACPKGASAEKVERLYEEKVRKETVAGVTRFCYYEKGKLVSCAYPLEGKGLWGMIRGFLSVEPDFCTVKKVTFYDQKETPGLGAEIVKPWFRKQFEGKKIWEDCSMRKKVLLRVKKKGTANTKYEVDGISGATITTKSVDNLVQKTFAQIAKTARVATGSGGKGR